MALHVTSSRTASLGTSFVGNAHSVFSPIHTNGPQLMVDTLSQEDYKLYEKSHMVCAVLSDAQILNSWDENDYGNISQANKSFLHCNFCDFHTGMETEVALLKHLLSHHAFFCNICNHVAFSKSSYIEHLRQEHRSSKESEQVSSSKLLQIQDEHGSRNWKCNKGVSMVGRKRKRAEEHSKLASVLLGTESHGINASLPQKVQTIDDKGLDNTSLGEHSASRTMPLQDPSTSKLFENTITIAEEGDAKDSKRENSRLNLESLDSSSLKRDKVSCQKLPNFLEETDRDCAQEDSHSVAGDTNLAQKMWETSLFGNDQGDDTVSVSSEYHVDSADGCCKQEVVEFEGDTSSENGRSSINEQPLVASDKVFNSDFLQDEVKKEPVEVKVLDDVDEASVKQEHNASLLKKDCYGHQKSQSDPQADDRAISVKNEPGDEVQELFDDDFELDNAESDLAGSAGGTGSQDFPALCPSHFQRQMTTPNSQVNASPHNPCIGSTGDGSNTSSTEPERVTKDPLNTGVQQSGSKKYDLLRSLLKRQAPTVGHGESTPPRALSSEKSALGGDIGEKRSPASFPSVEHAQPVRASDFSLREILSLGPISPSSAKLSCSGNSRPISLNHQQKRPQSISNSEDQNTSSHDIIIAEIRSLAKKRRVDQNVNETVSLVNGSEATITQQETINSSPCLALQLQRSTLNTCVAHTENRMEAPRLPVEDKQAGDGDPPPASSSSPLTSRSSLPTSGFTASEILKRLLVSAGSTAVQGTSSSTLFPPSSDFTSFGVTQQSSGDDTLDTPSLESGPVQRLMSLRKRKPQLFDSRGESGAGISEPHEDIENDEGTSDDIDFVYISDNDSNSKSSEDSDLDDHKVRRRRANKCVTHPQGVVNTSTAETTAASVTQEAAQIVNQGDWLLTCSVCPFVTLKVCDMQLHLQYNHSHMPPMANLALRDRNVLIYFCRGAGKSCNFFSSENQEIYNHIVSCYEDQLVGHVTENSDVDIFPVLVALSKFCRPTNPLSVLNFCLQCTHSTPERQKMIEHAERKHSSLNFGFLVAGKPGGNGQACMHCLKCKGLVPLGDWFSHPCRKQSDQLSASTLASDRIVPSSSSSQPAKTFTSSELAASINESVVPQPAQAQSNGVIIDMPLPSTNLLRCLLMQSQGQTSER